MIRHKIGKCQIVSHNYLKRVVNNLIYKYFNIIFNGKSIIIQGKQPTTGQKKSKDQIVKAASQSKGGHKVPKMLI